jgi:hypothetical protein
VKKHVTKGVVVSGEPSISASRNPKNNVAPQPQKRVCYHNSQPQVETLNLLTAPSRDWNRSCSRLWMPLHEPLQHQRREFGVNVTHLQEVLTFFAVLG